MYINFNEVTPSMAKMMVESEAISREVIAEMATTGNYIAEVSEDNLSPNMIKRLKDLGAVVEAPKVETVTEVSLGDSPEEFTEKLMASMNIPEEVKAEIRAEQAQPAPAVEAPKPAKPVAPAPTATESQKAFVPPMANPKVEIEEPAVGQVMIDTTVNILESTLVKGVRVLEVKGIEALNKLVCAFGRASKVSKLTKFTLEVAVWGYALNFVCDGIEQILNVNLDSFQDFLSKMSDIGIMVALIGVGFEVFKGWKDGTPEKAKDIIGDLQMSEQEIKTEKANSPTFTFLGL